MCKKMALAKSVTIIHTQQIPLMTVWQMYARVEKSSTSMENAKNAANIPYQITNENNVSISAKQTKM